MTAGRPLKFPTVEDLESKIQDYFDSCWDVDEKGKKHQVRPYTITGLALALDTTRETLLDYEDKDEYSDTIKKAKLQCQNFAEEHLFSGKNATGAIFNLKNNYSWRDKNETDITSNGESLSPVLVKFIDGKEQSN